MFYSDDEEFSDDVAYADEDDDFDAINSAILSDLSESQNVEIIDDDTFDDIVEEVEFQVDEESNIEYIDEDDEGEVYADEFEDDSDFYVIEDDDDSDFEQIGLVATAKKHEMNKVVNTKPKVVHSKPKKVVSSLLYAGTNNLSNF